MEQINEVNTQTIAADMDMKKFIIIVNMIEV